MYDQTITLFNYRRADNSWRTALFQGVNVIEPRASTETTQGTNNGDAVEIILHASKGTVWNLAVSLYNTAKAALGIHSPSTMFRDGVGKMLGLGVAEGMEDSQPAILDTVSDVADAMANEMQNADVVADIGANSSDLDTALATFSDKVAGSFSKLVDRLEEIAESVTFRMPDAAGAVVPYSVSANSSGSSAGVNGTGNDDQINALIQMFNNQTSAIVQAIEEYCGVEVRIGDKAIGDAAISEINRRARSTGKSPILV